jgi:hypothetical protein
MPKRNRISYAQKPLPFAGESRRMLVEPLRREWTAVTVAGALVLTVSVLYGYAVVSSIAQVSLRESALKETRVLTAERALLEGEFLSKTSGITEEYARSLGYRDAHERVFVTMPRTLSYAENAR